MSCKFTKPALSVVVFFFAGFLFLSVASAQEIPGLEPLRFPGTVESTGTHFEIIGSSYLNVTLDSAETIKLRMESVPETVTMFIEPASTVTSTQITLTGFNPNTTYYKYEDNYHNLTTFITDPTGSYLYIQDLLATHIVFIQPRASTKFIKDDATGGDCTSIGTWSQTTKTCALTQNVYETIQIDNDGITLDGSNYVVSGEHTGSGIYLQGRINTAVKNLQIRQFTFGIFLEDSDINVLKKNTVSDNPVGIVLYTFSDVNTLMDNTIDSSSLGVYIQSSSNNSLHNNTISNNGSFGGVDLYLANNNKIYNNNFINNQKQVNYRSGFGNLFYLAVPVGGNYWSDYDTSAEGCTDSNSDNFCDLPYVFTGGQDNLPWVRQDGWVVKTLPEKAADLAKELVNQPDGYLWGGKGWDYGRNEFIPSSDILASAGYQYLHGLYGKGVDCSGLITWAFNKSFDPLLSADYNFVQYINANGLYGDSQSDEVVEPEPLPGDAMFFDWNDDNYIDHTAMYVGESGGYDVVNAQSPDRGIVEEVKNTYKKLVGFKGFRRIHQADVGMEIVGASPIDIVVTDPDGFTITPNSVIPSDEEFIREVHGVFYYLEMEKGHDGNPVDRVYSPTFKTGNYTVGVIPATGSLPTDTYSLEFRGGGQTTILANNVPISQIPSEGYGVTVGDGGAVSTFIPVSIDIKPGSFPNSINLGSGRTFPVAIFGTATFDVAQIDPATITLANAAVKFKGNGQPMVSYQDVNSDSILDVVVHIVTEALQLTETDVKAELNGFLLDSRNIKGSDSIRVVP